MAYARVKNTQNRTHFQAVHLHGIDYTLAEIMDITGCSCTSLME